MTEFESIVRPFQNDSKTPSQTYYKPGQIGVPNLVLQLGRSGSGKMMSGSYNQTITSYCVKHEVEKPYAGTGAGGS